MNIFPYFPIIFRETHPVCQVQLAVGRLRSKQPRGRWSPSAAGDGGEWGGMQACTDHDYMYIYIQYIYI